MRRRIYHTGKRRTLAGAGLTLTPLLRPGRVDPLYLRLSLALGDNSPLKFAGCLGRCVACWHPGSDGSGRGPCSRSARRTALPGRGGCSGSPFPRSVFRLFPLTSAGSRRRLLSSRSASPRHHSATHRGWRCVPALIKPGMDSPINHSICPPRQTYCFFPLIYCQTGLTFTPLHLPSP